MSTRAIVRVLGDDQKEIVAVYVHHGQLDEVLTAFVFKESGADQENVVSFGSHKPWDPLAALAVRLVAKLQATAATTALVTPGSFWDRPDVEHVYTIREESGDLVLDVLRRDTLSTDAIRRAHGMRSR